MGGSKVGTDNIAFQDEPSEYVENFCYPYSTMLKNAGAETDLNNRFRRATERVGDSKLHFDNYNQYGEAHKFLGN